MHAVINHCHALMTMCSCSSFSFYILGKATVASPPHWVDPQVYSEAINIRTPVIHQGIRSRSATSIQVFVFIQHAVGSEDSDVHHQQGSAGMQMISHSSP